MSKRRDPSAMYSWKLDEASGMVTKTENTTGETWTWKLKQRPAKAQCSPRNGVSIEKLQEAGHKVRVRHLRWAYYLATEEMIKDSRRHTSYAKRAIVIPSSFSKDMFYYMLPKGGYTHITIKTKSGEYVCVSSECSKEDPFCYRKGVEKALERLSRLELNYLGV